MRFLDEFYFWARNMVMWYWSADTLFWQLLIGHKMDLQLWLLTKIRQHSLVDGRHLARLRRLNAPASHLPLKKWPYENECMGSIGMELRMAAVRPPELRLNPHWDPLLT